MLTHKNQFSASSHLFERVFRECNLREYEKLTPLMRAVPHIRIRDGFELDGYDVGSRSNAEMRLYARAIGSKDRYEPVLTLRGNMMPFKEGQYIQDVIWTGASVPPILDYLEFPFTPLAIWEAVLLAEASKLYLRHTWHGCYCNGMLVVDTVSLHMACDPYGIDCAAYVDDDRIPPSVEMISDDEAVVRYCYWNEWKGLTRVSLKIVRKGDGCVKEDLGTETIFEYHSGKRY